MWSVAFAVALASAPAPEDASLAERGQQLMQAKGCFACHSTDGSKRSGPSFQGLQADWGRTKRVATRDGVVDVTVDDAYIARALREPDSEVAVDYPSRLMPKYDVSDGDAHAIAKAIQYSDASKTQRGGSLIPLIGCCAAFVLFHFLLSAGAVKRQLQLAIGAKGFAAVYSILALASFAGMIVFYRTAPFVELWNPPRWTRWVPVLVMPLALLSMVAGFSTPSPTAAGQEAKVKEARPIGITAVTRHPALWGFSLWALSHLATNGELHVILVAASILILGIGGMLHIDARRKAALGADWDAYAAQTSLLPFAAIARGRTRLVPSEIGARRVLIAVALYLLLFFAHPYVIGASPSP